MEGDVVYYQGKPKRNVRFGANGIVVGLTKKGRVAVDFGDAGGKKLVNPTKLSRVDPCHMCHNQKFQSA